MKKCIALLLTGVMLLGLLSGCNTYQNDDSASSAGSTSNTADGVSADFTMAYNGGDSEPHYEPELQRF